MDREGQLLSSLAWKVPLPGELEPDGLLRPLSIQTILGFYELLTIMTTWINRDHNNII